MKKNNNKLAITMIVLGAVLFFSAFILIPLVVAIDPWNFPIPVLFLLPVTGMGFLIAGFAVGAAKASKEYQERYKNANKTYKYTNYSSYEGFTGGYCENCGSKIEGGVKFCGNCGANVEKKAEAKDEANDDFFKTDDDFFKKNTTGVCPSCGSKVDSGDAFCGNCGKVL